jgi:hypothetical protein
MVITMVGITVEAIITDGGEAGIADGGTRFLLSQILALTRFFARTGVHFARKRSSTANWHSRRNHRSP